MALWPFGRRKNRARKRGEGASSSSSGQIAGSLFRPGKSETSIPNGDTSASANKTVRRDSKRRKNGRDESVLGNEDSCLPPHQILTPSRLPLMELDTSSAVRSPGFNRSAPVESLLPRAFSMSKSQLGSNMSQSSLLRGITDVPTLRNKRSSAEPGLIRRKSSKRKRQDSAREQEIRNMSSSNWDLPSSKTYAKPGGVSSTYIRPRSMSPDSFAYKLNAFDALTPRPLLRYTEHSRYWTVSEPPSSLSKGKGKAFRLQQLDGKNKINELADDMDAGTLRELMDRDRRRREARRSAEQGLLLRKDPASPRRTAIEPTEPAQPDLNTIYHSSIHRKADNVDSSKTLNRSLSWLKDASKESLSTGGKILDPIVAKRTPQDAELIADDEKSFVNISVSDAANCMPDTLCQHAGQDMSPRQRSISSNAGRIGRSLSSLFRRGSRFTRGPRSPPSEGPSFSVPSRESFSKISHTEAIGRPPSLPKKSSLRFDGQSTRSKFTEHFDDLVSPDNIRSTSAIDIYPTSNRMSVCTGRGTMTTAATTEAQECFRASGANSPDTRPNSMFLAQSLASIDSEGSWLSGKPSRRLSQIRPTQYRVNTESKEKLDDPVDSPEVWTPSEEPFKRLGVPAEEEEDVEIIEKDAVIPECGEATTWHGSLEKRVRLVSPGTRAKSKEGLFTEFLETASDLQEPESETPFEMEGDAEVQRATSVDFGKCHARRISAGSAKLLDIPSRSVSDRRISTGTMSSGVLPSAPA
ncbi:hypothetical protein LOZ12_003569 [Ophidiomyces ophidiicola]|uniref:uncharacterized protein n=1 Tax=Ophidiomyces ophidiicola TaxID=1387563 RepID=UPI0020C4255D|nr:uncharacterized protein LOZ57_002943 [Ophidiomyces ophidiicola]KAI1947792.1 hypothetical protein LOZ57_002943 [Ophidiomyces ophidiicola]KAI1948814.1 hypothetical protein LOZ62_002494 [Ophidiomyces ophidiicola]KAI2041965.1 hypothetical protein LOZ47_000160 [Ophidiomyces ophidiicola]KAI2049596.1 hypothetical protein LOZ38_003760 [Ophidiomyces ophidiicola]KAI2059463.1 hypothetical protein LOZ43_002106 [Ophidiomyces ophidiicola]